MGTNLCLSISRGCPRSWSLAACQTMHGWRCEGKAQSREDEMAVQPRVPPRQFRWGFGLLLFTQCFPAHSPNPAERVTSVNGQKSTKVESRTSDVNCRPIVCGRRREKARTHVGALLGWVFLNVSCTTEALGGKNLKNRPLAQAPFREEMIVNQIQRTAKSKFGICAGFWFHRRGAQNSKAKQSHSQFPSN